MTQLEMFPAPTTAQPSGDLAFPAAHEAAELARAEADQPGLRVLQQISRADLVRALVKRAAVEVVEGRPMVARCRWCDALIAVSKRRPHSPPAFCRRPAPCLWKATAHANTLGFCTTSEWIAAGAPR